MHIVVVCRKGPAEQVKRDVTAEPLHTSFAGIDEPRVAEILIANRELLSVEPVYHATRFIDQDENVAAISLSPDASKLSTSELIEEVGPEDNRKSRLTHLSTTWRLAHEQ